MQRGDEFLTPDSLVGVNGTIATDVDTNMTIHQKRGEEEIEEEPTSEIGGEEEIEDEVTPEVGHKDDVTDTSVASTMPWLFTLMGSMVVAIAELFRRRQK